jgi:tetratricopeptide (TPR) repeat protein
MGNVCKSISTYKVNKYYNLAYKYSKLRKYDLMEKYFILAIKYDDREPSRNDGYYYEEIIRNYNVAKQYYLKAVQKDNMYAMIHLGNYYYRIENNYELMIKYYLMALQKFELDTALFIDRFCYDREHFKLIKKIYLIYFKYNKDILFYLVRVYRYSNYKSL